MKYRNLMTATTVIAVTCGILLALGPPSFIPHSYFSEGNTPLAPWPPPPQWIAYSLVRLLGGALVIIGFITGKMRNLERVEDQRNMARALFTAGQTMVIITLAQQTALWETRGAWFFISLILLIICGSLYLLFWELKTIPPESPAASQNPEELREKWIRQLSEAAAQQERNRLARDLHDSIKQQIFRINVAAATAQTRWESDPEGAQRAVADVRGAAREAMTEMEAMLQHLRPAPLENVGLIEALRKQCEALQYRAGATVTAEFGELPDNEILPPGAQEAIFRIAQEGLNNIARHARATSVRLRLHQESDGETPVLWLTLRDDGAGFDPGQSNPGMGLANIKLRAAEIGGTAQIESATGQGASLTVQIPLISPELDRFERQSKFNLAAGLAIIFFMGLVSPQPTYYLRLVVFLLPAASVILTRFWAEWRFFKKMRDVKNAPLKRCLTLALSSYQRALFFLAAFAFWGINSELALKFYRTNLWGNRFIDKDRIVVYLTLRLGIPLFLYALLFVLSRIHRLTKELKEKLAPQDFLRSVKQMQSQTRNVLLAATPIIALAVSFGRGLQPLGMLASLLLYLGYLAWWRYRK